MEVHKLVIKDSVSASVIERYEPSMHLSIEIFRTMFSEPKLPS